MDMSDPAILTDDDFNRTIEELKFLRNKHGAVSSIILIAPLRNWNKYIGVEIDPERIILIAPLRNWN